MRGAQEHGAVLRHGTVVDLIRGPSDAVRGVALASGEIVEGAVVIAMGPWSILAARWLPLPAVLGYKGHSLVFETGGAIPAEALFLEYREASGEILTPELFPRADGTTWVCAISTIGSLPVDPADVAADEGAHARLEALCRNISPALARRRSKRGRRASGRSPKTAFPSSAPCRVLTVPTWRPATVSGACSTRPRPARQ
jgi:glycine/D-amino acid oxidase-like deaminating enzyme